MRLNSLPRPARVLLALAGLLLLASSTYAVLAAEQGLRTEQWSGPAGQTIRSGDCSRKYRPLPSLRPPLPDYIRFDEQTYIRTGRKTTLSPRMQDTGYRNAGRRLLRTRSRLYIETSQDSLHEYLRGGCR